MKAQERNQKNFTITWIRERIICQQDSDSTAIFVVGSEAKV